MIKRNRAESIMASRAVGCFKTNCFFLCLRYVSTKRKKSKKVIKYTKHQQKNKARYLREFS